MRSGAYPVRVLGAQTLPLLRAVPGPQDDAFTEAGQRSFTHSVYTLTPNCDRMACKLAGAAIEMKHGADILSDGIAAGSVQVSADGQPIVMLADHQTTGGYAKIATVISADLPALAQLRPGQRTTPEPDAADRACRVTVFRLDAEHPALCVGPAALEAAAFLRRTGTVECRLRQLLFPVAQKRRITGDAPAKGGAGQVLDMTHEEAFLIVLRRDEAPHGTLLGINRTRHCSPARPAGRP